MTTNTSDLRDPCFSSAASGFRVSGFPDARLFFLSLLSRLPGIRNIEVPIQRFHSWLRSTAMIHSQINDLDPFRIFIPKSPNPMSSGFSEIPISGMPKSGSCPRDPDNAPSPPSGIRVSEFRDSQRIKSSLSSHTPGSRNTEVPKS
jgi:hypothetical protein